MAGEEETIEEGARDGVEERKRPRARLDTPFFPMKSRNAIGHAPINDGKVMGWVMVHRPFMVILVLVGCIVGYLLSTVDVGDPVIWPDLLVGLLAVALVVGGVDVTHEAWDKEVDAINKPYRPVPRGLVSQKAAWIVGGIEFAVGITLGLFVSLPFFLFLIFMMALTTHYSYRGKFIPVVGQLESTVGSAMVAYCGGVLAGDFTTLIPLCAFIFTFENGRWFMVNLEDMEADLARGKTTVYYMDPPISQLLALGLYVTALIVSMSAWFLAGYSSVYRMGSTLLAAALIMLWGLTATNGFIEEAIHAHHRNAARVWIGLYQVCLIVEAFI